MEAGQEVQVVELQRELPLFSAMTRSILSIIYDIVSILAAIAAHDNRWDS